MSNVALWTDGSGTTAATPGGWGYVLRWIHPTTGEIHEREGQGGSVTGSNNQMELSAVLHGLRALRKPCKVTVHSDSEYVVHAFALGWIDAWRNRNWVRLKNLDLWLALIEEAGRHDATFRWVPGHKGLELNERADRLAGEARKAIVKALEEGTLDKLPFEVLGGYPPLELGETAPERPAAPAISGQGC